jgi:hypothetical protein
MKKILLHACCGPCSTHCVETLRAQDYEPTLFYSNSNIMPVEEYRRRLDAIRLFSKAADVDLIEDAHDNDAWLGAVRGLEEEKEGGMRCSLCFRYNLGRAADYAVKHGFAEFTTSLTVSPHKRSAQVFEAGDSAAAQVAAAHSELSDIPQFMHVDFKKNNGFLNSKRLSEQYGLYRQTYCGCVFSMK